MARGFLLAFVALLVSSAVARWVLPENVAMWLDFAVQGAVFTVIWGTGWTLLYKRRDGSPEEPVT